MQQKNSQVDAKGAVDSLLELSESIMRSLEDYKLNISFLQAELSEIDFKQQELNSGATVNNNVDHDMLEGPATDDNLLQMSMCRTNSVKSRDNNVTFSKSVEVAALQTSYDQEISGLRGQITSLETKNKKYLEIIGMTASEN